MAKATVAVVSILKLQRQPKISSNCIGSKRYLFCITYLCHYRIAIEAWIIKAYFYCFFFVNAVCIFYVSFLNVFSFSSIYFIRCK